MEKGPIKLIAENRKARHDYLIVDQYEAGLVLTGTEVQSLRLGKANHEPLRVRKLLLHKREILRLYAKANEQGHTLVPLKLYFKAGKAKITLALAKGKREFDKREALRERDRRREVDRARRQR